MKKETISHIKQVVLNSIANNCIVVITMDQILNKHIRRDVATRELRKIYRKQELNAKHYCNFTPKDIDELYAEEDIAEVLLEMTTSFQTYYQELQETKMLLYLPLKKVCEDLAQLQWTPTKN